jgi:F0F1-type ATP synthase assembly protein I
MLQKTLKLMPGRKVNMVNSDFQNNLMPMIVLLAVAIINVGIMVGFLLNLAAGVTTTYLVPLVILEIVAVTLVIRQSKRRSENVLF